MSKKQKPDNGLDDTPQLMPIGKSGKGKGWQKYFQSNAVKAGVAGVVVLLLVLIIGWQILGGSEKKPMGPSASLSSHQAQPAPPPSPMPAEPAPATPDQKDTSADQNAQTGQENKQGQPAETQPEAAQPEHAQPVMGAHGMSPGAMPGAENTSTLPKLPDDISKWEKGDFVRARQENNPKLLEAVAYMGEKFPGSVPKALELADLLKTPKSLDPNTAPYAQSPIPGLIEATIDALGKNGSQAARQTLMQILSGKFTTDDDRAAVEAVLKTLLQTPSAENDDILAKVILSPEEIRPATPQGVWQPAELRTRALDLVKLNPSENLSIKLAEILAQKGLEPNDPVVDFLLQDNPANLNAQLRLYQSEDLPLDIKTKLEQYFLKYSSLAINLTMGIPSATDATTPTGTWTMPPPSGRESRTAPPGPGTPTNGTLPGDASKAKASDYERGAYLAKLLWGEPLAGLMTAHLGEVRTLEKSTSDIMLASTLPLDSIHAAMLKMLKKQAGYGPQSLEAAGWSDKVLTDPSLVVVMKLLLLTRSKNLKTAPVSGSATTSAPTATQPGRYPPPRRPTGADAGGAAGQPTKTEMAQRREQVELEWLTTLSKMVDAWCNRFADAAQAQKRAERKGQKVLEQRPTRLDEFEMPQDAKNLKDVKIIAAYQLNWPDKAPGDMGKVKLPGLKIQFFRIQLNGKLKGTMTTFKQLAKGGDIHNMSNGQWLELIKIGSQPSSKRSLDILVTSADKQAVDLSQRVEEPIDLEVDILAIEITDPGTVKE
ncbi:MAG: hypothetical protein ABSG67_11745 [Thermoguttaceae bacterium]|jgi:hypothetical protein